MPEMFPENRKAQVVLNAPAMHFEAFSYLEGQRQVTESVGYVVARLRRQNMQAINHGRSERHLLSFHLPNQLGPSIAEHKTLRSHPA